MGVGQQDLTLSNKPLAINLHTKQKVLEIPNN
jgi:hypothetical protein